KTFVSHGTWYGMADFFLLPVVAGVAVYAMKAWSYPVFLSISGWTIYSNVKFLQSFSGSYALPVVATFFVLDFTFVSYFLLLPTVRKIYFDSRLRWWEQKPRYLVEVSGSIHRQGSSNAKSFFTLDLSEGGVLVKTKEQFTMHEPLELTF